MDTLESNVSNLTEQLHALNTTMDTMQHQFYTQMETMNETMDKLLSKVSEKEFI